METQMSNKPEKSCFVIGPIGDTGGETRARSNLLITGVIEPAVIPLGYRVSRADLIHEPGSIVQQILDRLFEGDLVIADLTGGNPNVFYELALRHALRKPYVQIVADNQPLPFDVQGIRTIRIDLDDTLDAAKSIQEYVKSLQTDDSIINTPISEYFDRQSRQLHSMDYFVEIRRWKDKEDGAVKPFETRRVGIDNAKVDVDIYDEAVVYRNYSLKTMGAREFRSSLVSTGVTELEGISHSMDHINIVSGTYKNSSGGNLKYSVDLRPNDKHVMIRQRIYNGFQGDSQSFEVTAKRLGADRANLSIDFEPILQDAEFVSEPSGYFNNDDDPKETNTSIPIRKSENGAIWSVSCKDLQLDTRIGMEWTLKSR